MSSSILTPRSAPRPSPAVVLELLKPITWFPPMWAFGCGVISSGGSLAENWGLAVAGVVLAGPLLCATSQAVNDWFDRDVDAINEPDRPIPSGRMPGRWGLWIAIAWTGLSLIVAALLGPWVLGASALGLVLAWAYSAPPVRLKQNGWWGNTAVAFSYEGLAWITGAAVMVGGAMPEPRVLLVAGIYSLGAHGIMTLNDFKSVEGDLRVGVASLPAQLGIDRAAHLACWTMALPQIGVISLLSLWGNPWHAAVIGALLVGQLLLMWTLLADPRGKAMWYSGSGVTLYVLGMAVAAFALRTFGA